MREQACERTLQTEVSYLNYQRKIYRYILNGTVNLNDSISKYKLIAQNKFPNDDNLPIGHAVRFLVPNDMKIKQQRGTTYSTTEDTRTLTELDCKLVIKINGRWKENPFGLSLTNIQPHQILPEMLRKGYLLTAIGYLDREHYLYFTYHYTYQTEEEKRNVQRFEKQFQIYKKSQ